MTRNDCAQWLLGHDRYGIITHRRPDGDTLGSAAALCLGLRSLGKQAFILENPEVTDRYRHLLAGLTVAKADADMTVICVDVAAPEMLGSHFAPLQNRILLRIDHHEDRSPFTPNALVDPAQAACGEIIFDVLREMGVTLDKPMADAIYTAVSTDTGCFRYSNTTAHSFYVAGACKEAGADVFGINQALFIATSRAKLRLQGWMVENTQIWGGGKFALCALPKSVEQELGVTEDDMESISGFPRSIEGVKMAATLRENADGSIKISMRAIPEYDAGAICALFGGGGHRGAAGATVNMSLSDAAAAVKAAMPEL